MCVWGSRPHFSAMSRIINVVCANCNKHINRSANIKKCTHFCSSKCRVHDTLKIKDWKNNPNGKETVC